MFAVHCNVFDCSINIDSFLKLIVFYKHSFDKTLHAHRSFSKLIQKVPKNDFHKVQTNQFYIGRQPKSVTINEHVKSEKL